MQSGRPSIRPPVPPKPKLPPVASQNLRDSGISVSDYPISAYPSVRANPSVELSPVAGHVSGVRKLASRFETIALRHSNPNLTNRREQPPPPNRKPQNGTMVQQLQPKIENILVPSLRLHWDPALTQRATAIAEQIYDTVCEREHTEHTGSPCEAPADPGEREDPTSTDGYSSFESDSDDEDAEPEPTFPSVQCHSLPIQSQIPVEHREEHRDDHIRKVIDELIEKEHRYIETLDQGIRNYMPTMHSQTLPAALRGQRNVIFINLEEILRTHRDSLLPDLEQASMSPAASSTGSSDRAAEKVAEVFLNYIENDQFYCYVQYALHQPESEALRIRYNDYFLKVQHDLDDRLGLNSLLLQPIQRLPRYKLLLNEMVKELLRDGDGKRTMNRRTALLCKVDKRLSLLIDRVNQAINLHDIRQCTGSTTDSSLLTYSSEVPLTLILQPEGNRNPARDTPINLLYQGKFLRLFPVEIYDVNVRRKYSGKLFAFQKLLLYTEIVRDRLEYRGHFADSEVCYLEEGRNRIILYTGGTRGTQEIVVQSDTTTELQPMLTLLHGMTKAVIYGSVELLADTVKTHIPDCEEEEDLASSRVDATETLDEQRLTTALIEAQQQFVEVLLANRRFYLDTLSLELKLKLTSFINAFEAIMNLHRGILHDLSTAPADPNRVCQCFDHYLKSDVLDPYFEYLREFRKAMKHINHSQTPSNFHNRVASTVEQFTFLCIEHLQEYTRYFDVLIVHYSEYSTLNIPIDTELFKRLAYVLVQLNAYRANLTLNYDLFLIDERVPSSCGLVRFNERATVHKTARDTNGSPCRLFVCERAAVCVKVQDVPEHGQQVERFVCVLFLDRFRGAGSMMRMHKSKRQPERLNFLIDGVKFRIDFVSTQARNKFYSSYVNRYIML